MSTQVRVTHESGHTNRMGSGCGGERLGQEIVDAANSAGTQSATPLGPANLAGTRSDSTMQQEWRRRPIQRIYGSNSLKPRSQVTLNYLRYVLPCVFAGFHNLAGAESCRENVSRIKGSPLDPGRIIGEAPALDTEVQPAVALVARTINSRCNQYFCHPRTSNCRAATSRRGHV